MAIQYIDKKSGATTSTAIADDTTGRAKVKNLPDAAGIAYDSVDGYLKYNDAGSIRWIPASGKAVVGALATVETLTAGDTLLAAESGKKVFLGAAGGGAIVLPALAAGLEFEFIVSVAPTTAWTITTEAAANNLVGQVYCSAGTDEDSETAGADTLNFVANTAVVGDSATLVCNGTNWFVKAFCNATGGITITTAA